MEFGVTFPQTDIGTDPVGIRAFGEEIEDLGFEHLTAYDHILLVEPPTPEWDGSYDYTDQFHEPFVLFAHLAAVTTELRFMTGVLVLPQRQTELVAKQSAALDVLSDGRFELGVGVGWNDLEYRNLGKDFQNRGERIEEQIAVLRELWRDRLTDYRGNWHRIESAGINPLPTDRNVPIWIGGSADAVLRRTARQADGWMAPTLPLTELEAKLDTLYGYCSEYGRDPDDFPVQTRVKLGDPSVEDVAERAAAFEDRGVTHLGIGTMNMGLTTPAEHIEVLSDSMEALRAAGLQ